MKSQFEISQNPFTNIYFVKGFIGLQILCFWLGVEENNKPWRFMGFPIVVDIEMKKGEWKLSVLRNAQS